MALAKVRLRFAKTGPLRLISHHDLMRCVERMLRRAELPFHMTQGFHPTPRLIFCLACPLGVDGLQEVVELELTQPVEPDDVLNRLNAQRPAGLHFTTVRPVPVNATAVARRVEYTLALPPGRADAVAAKAAGLMAAPKVWVERNVHDRRELNVRPYFRALTVTPGAVTFDLWVTGGGAARGEELVKLLGLSDVAAGGAVLTRAALEIHDETPAGDPRDVPPAGPADVVVLGPVPLTHPAGLFAPAGVTTDAVGATWGVSPGGPAVE